MPAQVRRRRNYQPSPKTGLGTNDRERVAATFLREIEQRARTYRREARRLCREERDHARSAAAELDLWAAELRALMAARPAAVTFADLGLSNSSGPCLLRQAARRGKAA